MNIRIPIIATLAAVLLMNLAQAQPAPPERAPTPPRAPSGGPGGPPPPRAPGWTLDARHSHNRFYPPPGAGFRALPPGHHSIRHGGRHFYFADGIWYRPYRYGFTVVSPPIGAVIYDLPPFATRVWIDGVAYYYIGRSYYLWDDEVRGYVVASPRSDAVERDDDEQRSDDPFVYPAQGQSQAQQDTDRYECHRWAADQTTFDPTQPNPDLRGAEVLQKRQEYRRAETACLTGRGYTVK